ncbi:hypothetical protein PSPO01_08051 [Paraphaeosphaeria sporulosa]
MFNEQPRTCDSLPSIPLRGSYSRQFAKACKNVGTFRRYDIIHQQPPLQTDHGRPYFHKSLDHAVVIMRRLLLCGPMSEASSASRPLPRRSASITTWCQSVQNRDQPATRQRRFKVQLMHLSSIRELVSTVRFRTGCLHSEQEKHAVLSAPWSAQGTSLHRMLQAGARVKRDLPQIAPDQRAASSRRADPFNPRHEVERSTIARYSTCLKAACPWPELDACEKCAVTIRGARTAAPDLSVTDDWRLQRSAPSICSFRSAGHRPSPPLSPTSGSLALQTPHPARIFSAPFRTPLGRLQRWSPRLGTKKFSRRLLFRPFGPLGREASLRWAVSGRARRSGSTRGCEACAFRFHVSERPPGVHASMLLELGRGHRGVVTASVLLSRSVVKPRRVRVVHPDIAELDVDLLLMWPPVTPLITRHESSRVEST